MDSAKLASRPRPKPKLLAVHGDGLDFQNRPGVVVRIRKDGRVTVVQNEYRIPQAALDANARLRAHERRAPLGDSHGAWQKVAEIPLAFLLSKIPPDAWGDEKALARLLNDPDLRKFRTDGEHRKF